MKEVKIRIGVERRNPNDSEVLKKFPIVGTVKLLEDIQHYPEWSSIQDPSGEIVIIPPPIEKRYLVIYIKGQEEIPCPKLSRFGSDVPLIEVYENRPDKSSGFAIFKHLDTWTGKSETRKVAPEKNGFSGKLIRLEE